MAFLTDLATNATERGVRIVIYSGNDDSLVPHYGSEGKTICLSSLTVILTAALVVIQVNFQV